MCDNKIFDLLTDSFLPCLQISNSQRLVQEYALCHLVVS